jgi:hypothetical protein
MKILPTMVADRQDQHGDGRISDAEQESFQAEGAHGGVFLLSDIEDKSVQERRQNVP